MVKLFPLQIVPDVAATTGNDITVTVATAVFEDKHPAALVPVTEYDVVPEGDTVKVFPVTV
jgi:hypothetical protein